MTATRTRGQAASRPRAVSRTACHNFASPWKDVAQLPLLVAGLAFALAFVFGAVAQRVNFCTMGAVTDIVNFGDWRRMRMWLLAIAVAIAGDGALPALGLIDLTKTIYTTAAGRRGCRTSSAASCSASG